MTWLWSEPDSPSAAEADRLARSTPPHDPRLGDVGETRFVCETDADVVMVAGRYSLLDQTAARDLLPAALRRGVGVINAGVFNSGLLALPQPRPGATYDYQPASTALVERANHLARLCQQFGVDLPTVALAFAANHPAITSVVVGLRSPEEVADAIRRRAQPVPEGIWTALRQQHLINGCTDDARGQESSEAR